MAYPWRLEIKQNKWLEELKWMLSHIVSQRTLQKATKSGAPSWKFVHSPTLYLVRWVSEKLTCKDKKTSLQLFTVYAVPPDGVWDIARYTIPFALGKKSDHQPQRIEILRQTKGLEKVTSRFCKDTNSCEPTWFERVVIQSDQVEQVNNWFILLGGTYGKQVGHSIEFNEKNTFMQKMLFIQVWKTISITYQNFCNSNQWMSKLFWLVDRLQQ